MKYIIAIILFIFSTKIIAQEQNSIYEDTVIFSDTALTVPTSDKTNENIKLDYLSLTKSPMGAALRSLVFPGYGQIYTQSYLKASAFIGGATLLWYRVVSSHIDYKNYNNELNKIENKNSNEYRQKQGQMITAVDNRDLAGLYLLGVYILSMVDAYADAHLFDFSINSNLSYFIKPTMNEFNQPYIKIGISFFY